MLKLKLQYLLSPDKQVILENLMPRLKANGEEGGRRWDGQIARHSMDVELSNLQRWWTGKPVCRGPGLPVWDNWATGTELISPVCLAVNLWQLMSWKNLQLKASFFPYRKHGTLAWQKEFTIMVQLYWRSEFMLPVVMEVGDCGIKRFSILQGF